MFQVSDFIFKTSIKNRLHQKNPWCVGQIFPSRHKKHQQSLSFPTTDLNRRRFGVFSPIPPDSSSGKSDFWCCIPWATWPVPDVDVRFFQPVGVGLSFPFFWRKGETTKIKKIKISKECSFVGYQVVLYHIISYYVIIILFHSALIWNHYIYHNSYHR